MMIYNQNYLSVIKLTHEDEYWVALDQESGVASQGKTRDEALENLDEALELTNQSQESESEAPEPDAPWFE